MPTVQVPLGNRSYEIQVGTRLVATLGERCRRLKIGTRCAVITDAHVGKHYGEAAIKSLKVAGFTPTLITVEPGESSKGLATVQKCYDQLAAHRIERKSFIVALGGGVVGDLAGFVAATYLRGIAFVQVPTSLLAQVDSSVGGKVGVNLKAGKNLVGAFHQPRLVLCDLDTLTTLPEREFRSGVAEIVKYGVIHDGALFQRLEKQLDSLLSRQAATLSAIIARCCAIKAEIVSQDETETGLRATLNFGHTIGHAIENSSGYGKLLHGEAISIGQVAAAHLSARRMGLPATDVLRIKGLFERLGLPTSLRLPDDKRDKLFSAMRLDKKVSAGEIHFVLAEKIGKAVWGQRVPDAEVNWALDQIKG
ncbi:MAG: 3-dehydroquinate synthase [Verrucomicrobiota bacterium]